MPIRTMSWKTCHLFQAPVLTKYFSHPPMWPSFVQRFIPASLSTSDWNDAPTRSLSEQPPPLHRRRCNASLITAGFQLYSASTNLITFHRSPSINTLHFQFNTSINLHFIQQHPPSLTSQSIYRQLITTILRRRTRNLYLPAISF